MRSIYFATVTGILLSICVGNNPCIAVQTDPQFPLGTIGCLFTGAENLCGRGSKCIDDLLFGTCSESGIPANFAYTVTDNDLTKIQLEILKLVKDGFVWQDGYTQCILQNVIVSLTVQEPFSKKICYGLLFDWKEPVKNEVASVVENLYLGGRDLRPAEIIPDYQQLVPSQKRDEIIRVHKYFDKNEKIHKRTFWDPTLDLNNYLAYQPKNGFMEHYPRYIDQTYTPKNAIGWEDTRIPYEDFVLAKQYLDATRGQPLYTSRLSDLFVANPGWKQTTVEFEGLPDYDLQEEVEPDYDDIRQELEPGYIWNDDRAEEFNTEPHSESEELVSLPPNLANTFDKLIRGDINPENLTDKQLSYLTTYVSKVLFNLKNEEGQEEGQGEPDGNVAMETDMEKGQGQLEANSDVAMETDMFQGDDQRPVGFDEEDMMRMELQPDDQEEVNLREEVLGLEGKGEEVPDELLNKELQNLADADDDDNQSMDKKSVVNTGVQPVKNNDVVDTNFAFIEMDKPLNESTADKLLEALQRIVPTRPGSLSHINSDIQGTKLKINVDPILAGANASVVAQKASNNKEELEKATGLKFVKSGIGSFTEVDFKASDDRYFVLTFVLCGCIAGILLAVVVIYLIRRNSRSKEKLQQITAGQDGNEAASKDYQDLCRQRMQSKSSEKPEPLHTAASRVGSVSESQVRSPSSRSSTSSWSEEPVNSNMDISTGHIVLSYMEDHLKNKDRLEREWEGMCAYEADPCSTKVAEDPANARKNRYADVLPYDHSRVVLTTNTNVSGADYINASTITDHDPRNPAYVATQGPLPHTVADFWQMVWEQGSVVIVMLTKLTENGESKCHRYWPDEGSDLYHIYEVHLVSEHIWCEDYLVRSFYLKNLQTGETRTVTQFHFLTWPDLGIPGSIKALLDFRRKVNKSYRGRSCPIVVHCSDGCGRTGTYCLIDMVLNRMAKGAKEIDIAATLEHIRDQRINMVKTKEQFQFALAAVAEEVHAILKALPQ